MPIILHPIKSLVQIQCYPNEYILSIMLGEVNDNGLVNGLAGVAQECKDLRVTLHAPRIVTCHGLRVASAQACANDTTANE
jgi:hypothetical protein